MLEFSKMTDPMGQVHRYIGRVLLEGLIHMTMQAKPHCSLPSGMESQKRGSLQAQRP